MKVKNYEKTTLVFIGVTLLFILEMFSFWILYSMKIEEYQKMTGIIKHKNIMTIYANQQERKMLYQNQKIRIQDQEKIYQMEEDRGISMKVGKETYYEILLKIRGKSKYRDNEVIEFVIQKKKKKGITMLKTIWEGG